MVEIGPGRWAHPSGALWLPASQTAVVADPHFGYGWAQRRRGELGPLRDDLAPAKLLALLDELSPARLVLLGDIVHAPSPAPQEHALVSGILARLSARAELVMVRGNHDRSFDADFGATLQAKWQAPGLVAVHGDRFPNRTSRHIVAGHWHPAWKIQDAAGVRHRVPAFAAGQGLTILPAFSPFAAGLDLSGQIPPEWKKSSGGRFRIYAATGRRIVFVGEKAS